MQRAASIITSIAFNEMYELRKNTTAMEALCQTLSCANAPSCTEIVIINPDHNTSLELQVHKKSNEVINASGLIEKQDRAKNVSHVEVWNKFRSASKYSIGM